MEAEYYVYTLAYPDGRVFYVGKGSGKRMDNHEVEARKHRHVSNDRKIATIRQIWDSGGQVQKQIVARFTNELDAYMYEWALMNMTTYAEDLTNINRNGGGLNPLRSKQRVVINPPFQHAPTRHWGCLKDPSGRIHHQIQDIHSFAVRHKISVIYLIDITNGVISPRQGWQLAEECRGKNYSSYAYLGEA